jgi:hypothetical protein
MSEIALRVTGESVILNTLFRHSEHPHFVILNAVKNLFAVPHRPFATLRVTGESVILNAVKNPPEIPKRPFATLRVTGGKAQGDEGGVLRMARVWLLRVTNGFALRVTGESVILNEVKNLFACTKETLRYAQGDGGKAQGDEGGVLRVTGVWLLRVTNEIALRVTNGVAFVVKGGFPISCLMVNLLCRF